MSVSRQVNLNTAAQFFGKGVALVFTSASTFFLRRLFGREIYGDYIFILSIVIFLATMADFGTHLVTVKEANQNKDKQAKVLGNMFWLRLLVSLLTLFLGWSLSKLFLSAEPFFSLILLSLPLIILLVYKETLMVVFHASLKLYFSSLQNIIISFLLFLAALVLFFEKGSLAQYLMMMILIYFFVGLPFTVLAWRTTKISLAWDAKIVKKLFWQSLPLGAILLLFTVYSRLDTLILKFIWGSEAVGVYGLAYKIYETLVLPAAYLMNALLPVLSRQVLKPAGRGVNLLLQKASALLFGAAAVVGIIIFFSAPMLVRFFTGSPALPELSALRWLLPALPFAFLNHMTGYTIIALGEQQKSLKISGLALAFNFIANLIFVPLFSFKASAVITSATELLVLILTLRVVAKKAHFRFNYFEWPKIMSDFIKKRGRIFDE